MALGWTLHGDGKTVGPNDVVAPYERLSWGKTIGLGAQHVVAMFGATFVFPLIMGLNAQLAIMMSGIATICFLLIVNGRVPSYLGTSASFVGAVAAIRAQPVPLPEHPLVRPPRASLLAQVSGQVAIRASHPPPADRPAVHPHDRAHLSRSGPHKLGQIPV